MSAVSSLLANIASSFVFWAAWIVIPLIMEIVPALGSVGLLVRRRIRDRELPPEPALWPDVTVIVPVYNSADTLEACVDSIAGGTYPAERINVYLVNNASSDNSFEVFARAQAVHPELAMQWLDAAQGKSNALNLALYNSQGKYIVHVDSDGVLEPHALANLVRRFEADPTVNVATGAIMVEPSLVEAYRPGPARLLRRLEFMEYAQAFLAGRNYASEVDRVYTLSGAFTAFRSSAILTSWLYNADTICEDTQIAFQMRYNQRQRLHVCEDAIFFVDPIEGVDKLYTQRQRWQRGTDALLERLLEVLGGDGERLEVAEHVGEPKAHETDVALLDGAKDEVDVLLVCHRVTSQTVRVGARGPVAAQRYPNLTGQLSHTRVSRLLPEASASPQVDVAASARHHSRPDITSASHSRPDISALCGARTRNFGPSTDGAHGCPPKANATQEPLALLGLIAGGRSGGVGHELG